MFSHEVDTLIQRPCVSNIFNMCLHEILKFIVFKSECFCELLESGIILEQRFLRYIFHVKVFELMEV